MKLYIDDRYVGECERYYQKRDMDDPRWVFVTDRGMRCVSFKAIKSFDSCGALKITTNLFNRVAPDTVTELIGGIFETGAVNGKILDVELCSCYNTLYITTQHGEASVELDFWGNLEDRWALEKVDGKYYLYLR